MKERLIEMLTNYTNVLCCLTTGSDIYVETRINGYDIVMNGDDCIEIENENGHIEIPFCWSNIHEDIEEASFDIYYENGDLIRIWFFD